jgi:NAD(P)-dependent dehydrogenase (short-subunit alcohol dehydrogenase family)
MPKNPKAVIISGASGGLGRSVVAEFLKNRWHVAAVNSRRYTLETLPTAASITNVHNLSLFTADLRQEEDAKRLAADVLSAMQERGSSLRAVVCLAGGISAGTAVEDTPSDVFDAMFELNLKTASNLIAAALPLLKTSLAHSTEPERRGAIVTIGAAAAVKAEAKKSAYAAAKAALLALTETVALENEPHGIGAYCLVPTIINTEANRAWGTPDEIAGWTKPENIALAIEHLCADVPHLPVVVR